MWLAQATSGQPQTLQFDSYSVDEGLANSSVTALWRAPEGFLWVGSAAGVSGYQGTRILASGAHPLRQLPDPEIVSLVGDNANPEAVWIGMKHGGVARYHTRTQQLTPAFPALPQQVQTLAVGPDSVVWVGTASSGLYAAAPPVQNRAWQFERILRSPIDTVRTLLIPRAKPEQVWMGSTRGLSIYHADKQFWRFHLAAPGDLDALSAVAVTALADDGAHVWVGTDDGYIAKVSLAKHTVDRVDLGLRRGRTISTIVPSKRWKGVLWIGTRGQGLFAYHPDTGTRIAYPYATEDPTSLAHSDVQAVLEDDQGILWVGTRGGVSKVTLDRPLFTPILVAPPPGIDAHPSSVYTIYTPPSDPDHVWISTARGPVYRIHHRDHQLRPVFRDPELLDYVIDMVEDQVGNLWMGGRYPEVFLVDQEAGTAQGFRIVDDPTAIVLQLYEMPSRPGMLWIATNGHGLLVFDTRERHVTTRYTTASGTSLGSNSIHFMYEDPLVPEVLWLGTRAAGLVRLDTRTDAVTTFSGGDAASCLPDNVLSIVADPLGGFWLGGYTTGLTHFNPVTKTCRFYGEEQGVPGPDIGALFMDRHHRLWMTSNTGFAMLDVARGEILPFSTKDGLQDHAFYYQAQHQTPTGEIIVGGKKGINRFHPDTLYFSDTSLPTRITDIQVNQNSVAWYTNKHGQLQLPSLGPDQDNIRIEFASTDLRQPERNRYRMRFARGGIQPGQPWVMVDGDPVKEYPSLGEGTYTFEVQGTNADSYWGAQSTALTFTIRPYFWKSGWFYSLLSITVIGLVVLAYQYRITQLRRLEQTRHRIADDLHDDIGSKISNVALRLDIAQRSFSLSDDERLYLSDLTQTTRHVVDDLRDTVWLVDGENDVLGSLCSRMEQTASQFLLGRRHTFTMPDNLPSVPLGMEQRRHIYLFFKEALHNAVRHGEAEHIDVLIAYTGDVLTLSVVDDGVGFQPESITRGRGLHTLQARAQALGGTFSLASEEGAGTSVTLRAKIA
ncbi:MAG: two-component regulator propeller domain-containing protein [Bacteroidota bacterium]